MLSPFPFDLSFLQVVVYRFCAFHFLNLLFRAVIGIDEHAECIVFNRAENFVAEHFL